MAAPAANWILKKQEAFDVLPAKPGWTQPGRGTLNTFQRDHQPNSPAFCDGRRSTFDGVIRQLLGFKDVQKGRRDAWKGGMLHTSLYEKMALPTQRGTKAGASPQRPRYMDAQVCAGFARRESAIPKERLIWGAAAPHASGSPDRRGRRPMRMGFQHRQSGPLCISRV